MATRLTKALREEILANVLAATKFPQQKQDIETRTAELLRSLLIAKVPAEFFRTIATLPADWFLSLETGYLPCEHSPLAALSDVSWSGTNYMFEPFLYPAYLQHRLHLNGEEGEYEPFRPLYKEAQKLKKRIDKLTEEMTGFLQSCSTVEKVVERMPKLQRHVPTAAKFYAPVVSTAMLAAELTSAGFDATLPEQETSDA